MNWKDFEISFEKKQVFRYFFNKLNLQMVLNFQVCQRLCNQTKLHQNNQMWFTQVCRTKVVWTIKQSPPSLLKVTQLINTSQPRQSILKVLWASIWIFHLKTQICWLWWKQQTKRNELKLIFQELLFKLPSCYMWHFVSPDFLMFIYNWQVHTRPIVTQP